VNAARDADALESLLGGTQCGQCGFAGCRPYAKALARGEAGPERCAPGGAPTARALARALGRPYHPPEPARGSFGPRSVAAVIAELCVGCTRCLDACPPDAIAGTQGRLHYVLPSLCTGCGLCLPACPMDCIRLEPVESEEHWRWRRDSTPEDDPKRWIDLVRRSAEYRRRQADVAARRRRRGETAERRRRLLAQLADRRPSPETRADDPDTPPAHAR
jgi:electron transport complex protein RnfB